LKKPKPIADDFLDILEQGVRDMLKDGNIEAKDRLKALEVGSKLAAIKAKIDDGERGNFFK